MMVEPDLIWLVPVAEKHVDFFKNQKIFRCNKKFPLNKADGQTCLHLACARGGNSISMFLNMHKHILKCIMFKCYNKISIEKG